MADERTPLKPATATAAGSPSLADALGAASATGAASTARTMPSSPMAIAEERAAVKPALHLCGRRLRVASDDFGVTRALPCLLQLLWALTAAFLVDALFGDDAVGSCSADTPGRVFVAAWTAVAFLALLLDVALIALSLRGSIANAYPRRHVAPLFAVALVVDAIQARLVERAKGGRGRDGGGRGRDAGGRGPLSGAACSRPSLHRRHPALFSCHAPRLSFSSLASSSCTTVSSIATRTTTARTSRGGCSTHPSSWASLPSRCAAGRCLQAAFIAAAPPQCAHVSFPCLYCQSRLLYAFYQLRIYCSCCCSVNQKDIDVRGVVGVCAQRWVARTRAASAP